MAVKTTDFTKARQRLDSPSPAEKRMNPDRRPHRLLWVLGVLSLVAMAVGARYLINGSGGPSDSRDNEAMPPGVLAQALIDNAKGVTKIHALGEVVWVIEEGTNVKKGDLLLKVGSEREMAQFKQAEAAYEGAKALVQKAKNGEKSYKLLVNQQNNVVKAANLAQQIAEQKYARAQEVKKLGGISKEELKEAEINVERAKTLVTIEEEKQQQMLDHDPGLETKQAEADRDAKKAQLGAAKSVLDQCEKRAPANGKVLRVQTHVGEYLTANAQAPAVQFAPEGALIARAEVLQEWADRVHQGQEVIVETEPRSKQQWRGRVRSISHWFTHKRNIMLEPFMINDVRTLECIIDLEGNPPLRIGQRVRVTFVEK